MKQKLFTKDFTLVVAGQVISLFGNAAVRFALLLSLSAVIGYTVITVCCFMIMALSTIFTVQMMSVIQRETPRHLIGKVISVILTVAMCAQPLGSAFYGVLFEVCEGAEFAVIFFSGAVSLVIAVRSGKIFAGLGE